MLYAYLPTLEIAWAFLCLMFGRGVVSMRYEYSSKELYESYDNAETLTLKAHQRKLLQDRADRGNTEAKDFIRLIEAKEDKQCPPHHADNTAAQT